MCQAYYRRWVCNSCNFPLPGGRNWVQEICPLRKKNKHARCCGSSNSSNGGGGTFERTRDRYALEPTGAKCATCQGLAARKKRTTTGTRPRTRGQTTPWPRRRYYPPSSKYHERPKRAGDPSRVPETSPEEERYYMYLVDDHGARRKPPPPPSAARRLLS